MRLQIFGGILGDKLILEFVEWCPIDKVKNLPLKFQDGVWAVPGGGMADEISIKMWAKELGYSVKRKFTEADREREREALSAT